MAGLAPPQTFAASTVRPSMPGPGAFGNVRMNLPVGSNPYSAQPFPGTVNNYGFNGVAPMNVVPYNIEAMQNEAYQRRLTRLEDEQAQRRTSALNLQQMGKQILQGQMDIQQQVLQYQYMLEQCMETLDHQSFVLTGRTEELASLRSRMEDFEHLMESLKHQQRHKPPQPNLPSMERQPLLLCNSSANPLVTGPISRVTSSKFQPLNLRYRPSVRQGPPKSNEPTQ